MLLYKRHTRKYQKGAVFKPEDNGPDWDFRNWGVKNYTKAGNFNQAYKAAKTNQENEFIWNGKRKLREILYIIWMKLNQAYTTDYNGTPAQEVMSYGIDGYKPTAKEVENSARIAVYPPGRLFTPGHIAAEVDDGGDALGRYDDFSMDKRMNSNADGGISYDLPDKYGGNVNYYQSFGVDKNKFIDAVRREKDGDYNLVTNNCADSVCDAMGIKSKKLATPNNTLHAVQYKYPTMEITGRTPYDYMNKMKGPD